MLSQLFINNIAVIEKASIDFESGLTVLTGETGAGKSIIIDAISAVLGERTSKELIRTGADSASVSAMFTDLSLEIVALVESLGYEVEDGELLIQRDIKNGGKTVCRINGAPANVSALKQIGTKLISVHGQHESYDLLSPEVHVNYIDSFARLETSLEEYRQTYSKLRETQRKLESFNTDEGLKARQADLLRYQISELEEANIRAGEREELTQQRDTMRNSEKITEAVELSKNILVGDEDVAGSIADLSEAISALDAVAEYNEDIADALQKFNDAKYILEDAEALLRGVSSDYSAALLNEIEDRLDSLHRLGLKYGADEEAMLKFLENAQSQLHEIEFADEEREALEQRYEALKNKSIELAKAISRERKTAAELFSRRVKAELAFLNMPGVEFFVELERVPLYSLGCDKVQFMVSANKGEPPKPMSKIASGGELSRIMLAIKTVLAGMDKIPTLIFDEIDNGISGEAGNKVGLKLKEVSKHRQVVCITHLAQIAAYANQHLYISKSDDNERTFTNIKTLSTAERETELARIIGGDDITESRRVMAKEMLSLGQST